VRRSSNSTSFSPAWARAWDGHEVVDLAVGRLALHCSEENLDEVLAALDDKSEAVIRELAPLVRSAPSRCRRPQPGAVRDLISRSLHGLRRLEVVGQLREFFLKDKAPQLLRGFSHCETLETPSFDARNLLLFRHHKVTIDRRRFRFVALLSLTLFRELEACLAPAYRHFADSAKMRACYSHSGPKSREFSPDSQTAGQASFIRSAKVDFL
jgi:hypothetical protein